MVVSCECLHVQAAQQPQYAAQRVSRPVRQLMRRLLAVRQGQGSSLQRQHGRRCCPAAPRCPEAAAAAAAPRGCTAAAAGHQAAAAAQGAASAAVSIDQAAAQGQGSCCGGQQRRRLCRLVCWHAVNHARQSHQAERSAALLHHAAAGRRRCLDALQQPHKGGQGCHACGEAVWAGCCSLPRSAAQQQAGRECSCSKLRCPCAWCSRAQQGVSHCAAETIHGTAASAARRQGYGAPR